MSLVILLAVLALAGYLGYKYVVAHKARLLQDVANKISAHAQADAKPVVAAPAVKPANPSQPS